MRIHFSFRQMRARRHTARDPRPPEAGRSREATRSHSGVNQELTNRTMSSMLCHLVLRPRSEILVDMAPSLNASSERNAIPRSNPTKERVLELLAEFFCLRPKDAARLLCSRDIPESDARYPSSIGTGSCAVLILAIIAASRVISTAFQIGAWLTRSRMDIRRHPRRPSTNIRFGRWTMSSK
jgi:hypothetical protein